MMPAAGGGPAEPSFIASITSGAGAPLAGLPACVAGDKTARYPEATSAAAVHRGAARVCATRSLVVAPNPTPNPVLGSCGQCRYFGQKRCLAQSLEYAMVEALKRWAHEWHRAISLFVTRGVYGARCARSVVRGVRVDGVGCYGL